MSRFTSLWLLIVIPIFALAIGCSGKSKSDSSTSSSASRSSSSGSDNAELQKENDRLRKVLIDRLVAEGNKALDDKRYEDAKKLFKEALDNDSHDLRADNGLKQAEAALQAARDGTKKDEDYARLMKTGQDALDKKDYALAVRSFQTAYDLKKDDDSSRALSAAQKAQAGDEADAKKLADYKAQIDTGDKFMVAGNYKDALLAFNKALVLIPGDAIAAKKAEKAEARLDEINKEKANKEKYDRFVADGRFSLGLKKFDDAIQSFTKANNLLPQDLEAQRALKDAKDKQRQALSDYEAAMLLGNQFAQGGMFELARAKYDEAKDAYPDNADKVATAKKLLLQVESNIIAYNQALKLGRQFLTKKMYEAAAEQFKIAVAANPTDDIAATLLKEALDKLKDAKAGYDKAIAAGNKALQQKNYAEAVKDFDDALLLAPGDQVASQGKQQAADGLRLQKFDQAMRAGETAMAAKNYKEAVRQFELALDEKPNDPTATTKLKLAKAQIK